MTRSGKFLLAVAVALPFAIAPARASLIFDETTTFSGGNVLYTFSASLDNFSAFDNGGFITVYDLPGTPITTSAPAGFTATTQLLGENSVYSSPGTDNPALYNVTLTNVGARIAPGSNIATFTVLTNQAPAPGSFLSYIYTATNTSTLPGDLSADFYVSSSAVNLTQPTPEPSALGLLAVGLIPVAFFARRKYRRA